MDNITGVLMSEVTQQQVKSFALTGLKLLKLPVTIFTDFNDSFPFCASVEKYGTNFILRVSLKNITLDRKTWKDVVAHELIHMSQMHSGRLHTVNGLIFWCGENWTDASFAAHIIMAQTQDSSFYMKLPWEAEAFEKSEYLAICIEELVSVT
jgi:hypothetical protein